MLCLFSWIFCGACLGQQADIAKNAVYLGAGRQAMTYVKYERVLLHGKHWQTNINAGLGNFPGEHDTPDNEPAHRIVTMEAVQLIGLHNFYLELGVEPAVHFYGNVTFTDLNAIAGLRYQAKSRGGLFAQLGYNPTLFNTYEHDIAVPFYAGVGIVF